jgi:hypothetical protein
VRHLSYSWVGTTLHFNGAASAFGVVPSVDNLWRVRGPGGVSDVVNLTRAKDAAVAWHARAHKTAPKPATEAPHAA